jgi:hypothetical protein
MNIFEELGLTGEEIKNVYKDRMRYQRDRLLAESDWTQVADAPVDREAWAQYRQALRDFPSTWEPSDTADFPDPPS